MCSSSSPLLHCQIIRMIAWQSRAGLKPENHWIVWMKTYDRSAQRRATGIRIVLMIGLCLSTPWAVLCWVRAISGQLANSVHQVATVQRSLQLLTHHFWGAFNIAQTKLLTNKYKWLGGTPCNNLPPPRNHQRHQRSLKTFYWREAPNSSSKL